MAGIPNPQGVELDGRDISALLTRGAPSPHDQLFLFNDEDVAAVRTQRWKYGHALLLSRQPGIDGKCGLSAAI